MVIKSNIINLDILINDTNKGFSNQINTSSPSLNIPVIDTPVIDTPVINTPIARPILLLKGLYIRIFRYRR